VPHRRSPGRRRDRAARPAHTDSRPGGAGSIASSPRRYPTASARTQQAREPCPGAPTGRSREAPFALRSGPPRGLVGPATWRALSAGENRGQHVLRSKRVRRES
jgi:hypothetical protein